VDSESDKIFKHLSKQTPLSTKKIKNFREKIFPTAKFSDIKDLTNLHKKTVRIFVASIETPC